MIIIIQLTKHTNLLLIFYIILLCNIKSSSKYHENIIVYTIKVFTDHYINIQTINIIV